MPHTTRDTAIATGAAGAAATLIGDIRLGARRLMRSPGFAVPAVLTLALAIGVNSALFGIFRPLVLSPLPFDDGDRLVFLWRSNGTGSLMLTPQADDLERWRLLDRTFEDIQSLESHTVILTGAGEPEEISASAVSVGLLPMLGVRPVAGRWFGPAEFDLASDPTAILSYGLWQRRFGADAAAVGRRVRLGDEDYRVVGIMPPGFALPMGSDSLWLPLREPRERGGRNTIARLREGVTPEAAQAALTAAGPSVAENGAEWTGHVMPPSSWIGQSLQQTVTLLAGAVGLLLLLAAVNVANLIISRNSTRRQELAIRAALGASRGRLARLLIIEAAIVAGAGGLVGLGVAALGLEALVSLRPASLRALDKATMDQSVVMFGLALTTGTAVFIGLLPALRAARANLREAISTEGRTVVAAGHVGRGLLGAVQIATALVLVIGALLLTQTLANLTSIEPGFDPAGVLAVDMSLNGPGVTEPEARARFLQDLQASVAALPDVVSAATALGLPPSSGITFGSLEVEGNPPGSGEALTVSGGWVSPGYFATLRIPIREGREFTAEDLPADRRVVIVSESFARKFLTGPAMGSRIRMSSRAEFATVIGVAADVRANGLTASELSALHLYYPLRSSPSALLIVRAADDPLALVDAIKAQVHAFGPGVPIRDIETARQRLWRATATSQFGLALLALFAVIGLVLAGVGVFGVLTLIVSQRRREMAVRLSLGATHRQVVGLVGRYACWVTGLGILLGLAGAKALSDSIASLLTGVDAADVQTLAVGSVTVWAAALLAAIAPARRLKSVDPLEVLRSE